MIPAPPGFRVLWWTYTENDVIWETDPIIAFNDDGIAMVLSKGDGGSRFESCRLVLWNDEIDQDEGEKLGVLFLQPRDVLEGWEWSDLGGDELTGPKHALCMPVIVRIKESMQELPRRGTEDRPGRGATDAG